MKNYKEILEDFCEELLLLEHRAWKPVQIFRNDEEVKTDEIRYECLSEVADKARKILQDLKDTV